MKIVFHDQFHSVYTRDPAAASGRLIPAEKTLGDFYDFIAPDSATEGDILRVHAPEHFLKIRGSRKIFAQAMLAAGGAIAASEIAVNGEAAFALVRPPGHHAGPDSCWGFCFFNNMAVAVARLLALGEVRSALILDIDIHFGDGTYNIFKDRPSVQYLHPDGDFNGEWLMDCEKELKRAAPADIIAVSAGFDSHADDWGEILLTEDYGTVGKMVKEWAAERCHGRKPFVVLEGGYNYHSIAEAALALCQGIE